MSPTKRPFQPIFFALVANRSMKRMSCGLPQLRLRDGRMTCQVGPVIGSDTAPETQPSKSPPIERGGPGNGVDLRANSSLAGVDGASGFFSGGKGTGLSEPRGVGSIKCFCCATAELAAASMRMASRRAAARISNFLMDLCRIGGAAGDGARPAPSNVRFWHLTAILALRRKHAIDHLPGKPE